MAAESHNQHKSVVPVSFRNWKGVHTHQLYLWKGDFKQSAVHGLDKESFVEEMKMLLSFHRIDPAFGMQMFLIRHSSSRQSLCFDKPFQANAFTRVVPFCWICGALLSEYVSSDRESEEQRFHAIAGNQQIKQELDSVYQANDKLNMELNNAQKDLESYSLENSELKMKNQFKRKLPKKKYRLMIK